MTPLSYLTSYVHRLSFCRSMNLKELAIEAGTDNFRLRAPFVLYVIFSGNQDRLLKILNSDYYKYRKKQVLVKYEDGHHPEIYRHIECFDFYQYCSDFFSKYNKDNIVTALEDPDILVDNEEYEFCYQKCWESYICEKNFSKRDVRMVELYRKRVLEYKERFDITNIQIYKDLGLNAGNVNSWLNRNKETIGMKTAYKIFKYCQNVEKLETIKNTEKNNCSNSDAQHD